MAINLRPVHESLKLYWELYFEKYSNAEILKENNLLRDYMPEMIDGPIADIGCGQSGYLLEFMNTKREIFAIDNEEFQLELLKKRVLQNPKVKIENWHFLNLNLENEEIPDRKYSLIICSNIFHFFNLYKCLKIGKLISKRTCKGSLIYVQVHSNKHHSNNTETKNKTFNHFFKLKDLDRMFSPKLFERIYTAEIQKESTNKQLQFKSFWLDKWLEKNNITDINKIQSFKKENLKENSQSYITTIYRRK